MKTEFRVDYGCGYSGSQIAPLRVLFLYILKIFCSEVSSRNAGISGGYVPLCPLWLFFFFFFFEGKAGPGGGDKGA